MPVLQWLGRAFACPAAITDVVRREALDCHVQRNRAGTQEAGMVCDTTFETLKLEAECHEWNARQDFADGRLKECIRNAMMAINYYKMLLEEKELD
jgi:hypothetical protein